VQVKIIDFGFSVYLDYIYKERLFCGTKLYMSPELLIKKPYYPGPADIWALGVMMYILICGKFPYKAVSKKDIWNLIMKKELKFP